MERIDAKEVWVQNNQSNQEAKTKEKTQEIKVTPTHDITWFIKWIATTLLLVATAARTTGIFPTLDLFLTAIGAAGWAWVGYRWKDRALLVVNCVALVMLVGGILRYTVGGQ